MTYRELYSSYLEQRMAQGGAPADMEWCVTEYNRVGSPTYNMTPEYVRWSRASLHCSVCGKAFTPDVPGLDEETLCGECRKEGTSASSNTRGTPAADGSAAVPHA